MSADTDEHAGPLASTIASSRSALGIPEGAIGFGHQPGAWHMGILAKQAEVVRTAPPGASVHAIADHDANDECALVRTPITGKDGLAVLAIRIAPASPGRAIAHRPAVAAPTGRDAVLHAPFALPWIRERMQAFLDGVAEQRSAPSLAVQVAHANQSVLHSLGVRPCAVTITTSALLSTDLGRALVDLMLSDPRACAQHYNDALKGSPRVGRTLVVQGASSELPLWLAARNGVRLRATAPLVRAALARGEVPLPRALVATGVLRLLLQRFVHGTGGARYEQAGERWWSTWAGIELPPFSVATADVTLPLPQSGEARHDLHRRAWVNPELLESSGRALAERRLLLAQIAGITRGSPARRAAYRELRALIDGWRARHALELDALADATRSASAARRSDAVASDRTWSAILHDTGAIAAVANGSGR